MRAAPPVEAGLGPSGGVSALRLIAALLHGLTAVVLAAWAVSHAWPSAAAGPQTALLALAAVVGVLLGRACFGVGRGHAVASVLCWTGLQWQVRLAGAMSRPDALLDIGPPTVALDGGDWLLLHWRCPPAGRRRWALASAGAAGAAWHGLRLALAHGRPPAAPTATAAGRRP